MAIPAQGLVFTWGEATLQEVQSLEVTAGLRERDSAGRGSGPRTYRGGEITLVGLSTAGLPPSDMIRYRVLTISVPVGTAQSQILWKGYAQYIGCNIRAAVNGAVSFAFQFRLRGVDPAAGTIV
jgi:hypothetical protein